VDICPNDRTEDHTSDCTSKSFANRDVEHLIWQPRLDKKTFARGDHGKTGFLAGHEFPYHDNDENDNPGQICPTSPLWNFSWSIISNLA
jgi:hypothetical protein